MVIFMSFSFISHLVGKVSCVYANVKNIYLTFAAVLLMVKSMRHLRF